MVLKVAERFYLTLEVDMDSMTVILIKDGNEGRTYDANQYFQYFVEYGVRKTDVVQLQEHFSIDYFQNMLVTGKKNETFEFCVQFVGEDYKILKCKMKVLESQKNNIIKILLEDISHKRVQQLVYIKKHFEQHQHKSYAKTFDIKFEEQKDNDIKKQKRYRYATIIVCVLCISMSIVFLHAVYSENIEKAADSTLNNCKSTNQCISQQLNCISCNLITFKDLISGMENHISKKELIKYLEAEKAQYYYENMAFIDKNDHIFYMKEPMDDDDIFSLKDSFRYNSEQRFYVTGDYSDGNILVNHIMPAEGLVINGVKYKAIVTIFDLNKICSSVFLNKDSNSYDIMIINKAGDILWGGNSGISEIVNQRNLIDYLNKGSVKIKSENKIEDLSKNLELEKSGTFNFSVNGQRKFAAYIPLGIQDLYVVSLYKSGNLSADEIKLLATSIIIWLMALVLIFMLSYYKIRRIKSEKNCLENIAYSDDVTGGMNHYYFDKKAKSIISEMECHYALVETNLHNFNLYNSKYGLVRGNEVIRRLFLGISKYIDDDELVCRGYAEHMLILMKYEGENQLEERLVRIGKCIIDTNFKLEFGVFVIRDLTMDLEVAKKRANMAFRNEAKKQNNNSIISYYDVKLLEKIMFEKKLENTMYRAFRNGEFKIFVEPRYNLQTRALCNGDAYAIWEHPEKGTLMPKQYVGVFERRGLIMCLDSFIFEEICKKIKEHLDKGQTCMCITIKLHRNHFNVSDFINKFRRIKERYEIPGKCISFEISEEIIYEKINQIEKIVEVIHEMGASCIMGEYRGRYLSLETLCESGIDAIKFNPTFLEENLPVEMIDALIKIAKSANAKAIMTGVATPAQVSYLASIDCDEAKGDVFAKNISLDEFINIF